MSGKEQGGMRSRKSLAQVRGSVAAARVAEGKKGYAVCVLGCYPLRVAGLWSWE